jgi:hypothetical protein
MTGHHGHILQVAVAALFADRAVVRVVGHQPLHYAFAELLRFASSIEIKVPSDAGVIQDITRRPRVSSAF